jgi:hypothetical protein
VELLRNASPYREGTENGAQVLEIMPRDTGLG